MKTEWITIIEMEVERAADLLEAMDPDDAADLLGELPDNVGRLSGSHNFGPAFWPHPPLGSDLIALDKNRLKRACFMRKSSVRP